jgi:hypothetical protein
MREDGAEVLVVGDRSLIDLLELVKGAVGQLDAVVPGRKPAIGTIATVPVVWTASGENKLRPVTG